MADDAAGLIRALGLEKANVLAYSLGARIGQQLLIRYPDLVAKAVLAEANPGGDKADSAAEDVEAKLNNPDVPNPKKIALCFTDDAEGREAAKDTVERLKAAVAAGTIPDDFAVSKEIIARQTRARTVLWSGSNENFDALRNIRIPVLLTDGRSDVIDPPKNSLTIANPVLVAGILRRRARLPCSSHTSSSPPPSTPFWVSGSAPGWKATIFPPFRGDGRIRSGSRRRCDGIHSTEFGSTRPVSSSREHRSVHELQAPQGSRRNGRSRAHHGVPRCYSC